MSMTNTSMYSQYCLFKCIVCQVLMIENEVFNNRKKMFMICCFKRFVKKLLLKLRLCKKYRSACFGIFSSPLTFLKTIHRMSFSITFCFVSVSRFGTPEQGGFACFIGFWCVVHKLFITILKYKRKIPHQNRNYVWKCCSQVGHNQ